MLSGAQIWKKLRLPKSKQEIKKSNEFCFVICKNLAWTSRLQNTFLLYFLTLSFIHTFDFGTRYYVHYYCNLQILYLVRPMSNGKHNNLIYSFIIHQMYKIWRIEKIAMDFSILKMVNIKYFLELQFVRCNIIVMFLWDSIFNKSPSNLKIV